MTPRIRPGQWYLDTGDGFNALVVGVYGPEEELSVFYVASENSALKFAHSVGYRYFTDWADGVTVDRIL